MAGKSFALSVVLKAIDKATGPLRAVSQTAQQMTKPFDKIRTSLNALRIKVDSSMGNITKAFSKAKDKIFALGKTITGAYGAIQSFAVAQSTALFMLTKKTAEYGDEMWKTSQKTGIQVEAWQELVYAGKMSGVELQQMTTGMGRFSKSMVDAATGNKTNAEWFRRAGVAIKDSSGKIRSTEAVLMDLAGQFEKMPDGPKKTAIAMGILGRAGTDMIPFLNTGRKGIVELRKEARKLGIVLDEDTAKVSENFNDNMERITRAVDGFKMFVGSALLPVINDIVVSINGWIDANRGLIQTKMRQWVENFKKSLPELIEKLKSLRDKIFWLMGCISDFIDRVGGLGNALKILAVIMGVTLVGSIASAVMAIVGLGAALLSNPAGWIIMGIAAAALAGYAAVKYWDKIKSFVIAFGHILMTPLRWFGYLVDYLTSFDLLDIGVKIILSLWNGMKSVWGTIASGFRAWVNMARTWWGNFSLLEIGARIFSSLWDGMKSIWQTIVTGFIAWKDMIAGWWSSFSLYDIGVGIINSLWSGLKAKWEAVASWFKGLKQYVPDFLLGGNDGDVPTSPLPRTPFQPTHAGMVTQRAAATTANGIKSKAQQDIKSSAAVEVKFANLPKGTTVTTMENKGVDLKLNQGYAFATQ